MLPQIWSLALLALPAVLAGAKNSYLPCLEDSERRNARAKELQELVAADQSDRTGEWQILPQDQIHAILKRDLMRRKRVGEIFGEGCMVTAADFAAAALVFQHGDAPEHFFQTFLWAKRAVELGDANQKRLVAYGIDRFLVNTGKRQLFGSQFHRSGSDPQACWCQQPVEASFPNSWRREYTGKSLRESRAYLKELNRGKNCPRSECPGLFEPSPRGTVPGFW